MTSAITNRPPEEHLAQCAELCVLDTFWRASRDRESRLQLLLFFTRIKIDRPASWDPARVRREHEEQQSNPTIVPARDGCFGCDTRLGALYFHHIIEIQHGGSNTARNKVSLCFNCHQYLHPWLKEPAAPPKTTGFVHIGDIPALSSQDGSR